MRPRSDQRQKPKMQVTSKPAKKKLNRNRHQPLDVFFSPKTVAVIGATETVGSVGRTTTRSRSRGSSDTSSSAFRGHASLDSGD